MEVFNLFFKYIITTKQRVKIVLSRFIIHLVILWIVLSYEKLNKTSNKTVNLY